MVHKGLIFVGFVLRSLGWLMTTGAVVVLLFVLYQYKVTDLRADQAQAALRRQLARAAAAATDPSGRSDPPAASGTEAADEPSGVSITGIGAPTMESTGAVGILRIPRLDLDSVVLEGADQENLHSGPGHVRGTAMPGETGNSVIVGHRTTWGAPFGKLDRLRPGDRIEITTADGRNSYVVTEPDRVGVGRVEGGHLVIRPDDLEVLDQDSDGSRLTLITCHPRFSAAHRLVVVAELEGPGNTEDTNRSAEDAASVNLAAIDYLAFSGAAPVTWRDAVAPGSVALLCWVLAGRLAARRAPRGPRRWPGMLRSVAWYTAGLVLAAYPLSVTFDRVAPLLPLGG